MTPRAKEKAPSRLVKRWMVSVIYLGADDTPNSNRCLDAANDTRRAHAVMVDDYTTATLFIGKVLREGLLIEDKDHRLSGIPYHRVIQVFAREVEMRL